jgi:GNAT superfamily N-acetyltransferase
VTFDLAQDADVPALAALHSAVAASLTRAYGEGHWSSSASEAIVRRGITTSKAIVARDATGIAGTARLDAKRPWAISPKPFAQVRRPLYLIDMAVRPSLQRSGLGRLLIEQAVQIARVWPGDSIRLDAYDAPAGAGAFYLKCGFTEVARADYKGVPLVYFERLL